MFFKTRFDTPLGPMTAVGRGEALAGLWFDGQRYFAAQYDLSLIDQKDDLDVFVHAKAWLDAYFSCPGVKPSVSLPPLAPHGTDYQKAVWAELLNIPYASVSSYSRVAAALSSGARAAAGAVAHNPILIMIPCHRVIKKSGALGGFAAGPDRKLELLRLEHVKTDDLLFR